MAATLITCHCRPLCSCPTSIPFPPPDPSSSRLSFPTKLSFSGSRFAGELALRRSRREVSVVTRAAPTTTTLVVAFVFPLTLLVITIFTAMRIGDRLDQKFLEEMSLNEAISEFNDEEEDAVVTPKVEEEVAALGRARNRPKREV